MRLTHAVVVQLEKFHTTRRQWHSMTKMERLIFGVKTLTWPYQNGNLGSFRFSSILQLTILVGAIFMLPHEHKKWIFLILFQCRARFILKTHYAFLCHEISSSRLVQETLIRYPWSFSLVLLLLLSEKPSIFSTSKGPTHRQAHPSWQNVLDGCCDEDDSGKNQKS